MDVLPAIDLRGGKCVRLMQGQYDRQITYGDDPAAQAQQFAAAGADWLHVVDLDGAKKGRLINAESIAKLTRIGNLRIEVGGGIRDEASIEKVLSMGVERVIIGTRAVADFEWFADISHRFSHRLVLGLDARGSKLASHGWTKQDSAGLLDFAKQADELPLAAIIYTDIERDGMLTGANLARTQALAEAVSLPVIAAGGIGKIDDIKKLRKTGAAGVVIGRALYEGTLRLAEAIKAAIEL